MHVHVSTDNHIHASAGRSQTIAEGLEQELARFSRQITTVEVHLSDENGPKGGDDKKCLIEARLARHAPIVASHKASNEDDALDGAAEKLVRALESSLGRLHDPRGRTSYGGDQII